MWSVFIKEWRQNRHSTTFGILLIIAAVAEAMAALAIYAPVSTIDSASTAAENIVATVQVINGLFAVILIAMAGNR
jgi:uncharacterized membrane protein YozB (DUF420 family)